ncbi:MAG: S8 family serine peptidase [Paraclostridium sp.]
MCSSWKHPWSSPVVVGPVGEEGALSVNAPCTYPNVFSITAIAPTPDKEFDISNLRLISKANTGAGVGFSAPGNSLKTLTLGNQYTNIASGTGIAAAYVSGGIALILPLRRLSVPNNSLIYDNLYKILAKDIIKTPQLSFTEGGEGLANFKFIVE